MRGRVSEQPVFDLRPAQSSARREGRVAEAERIIAAISGQEKYLNVQFI
jgi:hypothetical protein